MSREWIFLYDKKPIREGWQRAFLLPEEVGGGLHLQFIMNEQWGVECMDVVTNVIAWMSHSLHLTSEWIWLDLLSACQKGVHIVWLPCNNVTSMVMFCHHNKWIKAPDSLVIVEKKTMSLGLGVLCDSCGSTWIHNCNIVCVITNVVVQWVQQSLLFGKWVGSAKLF